MPRSGSWFPAGAIPGAMGGRGPWGTGGTSGLRAALQGNRRFLRHGLDYRRMPLPLAQFTAIAATAYLGLGLLFAVPFVSRWAGRLDPVAARGTPGFRVLILPGAVLLWPWLGWKLLRTRAAP